MKTLKPYAHGVLHGITLVNLVPPTDIKFIVTATHVYGKTDHSANKWTSGMGTGIAISVIWVIFWMLAAVAVIFATRNTDFYVAIPLAMAILPFPFAYHYHDKYNRQFMKENYDKS